MCPIELAATVREKSKLREDDPVLSVVAAMEAFGIRVLELTTDVAIDGLAAVFGREFAVVLNPKASNDRCRMNAAHELAHVLYGDCTETGKTTKAMDEKAFEFACALLIPHSQLVAAFSARSAVRLVEAKERFGISMAAMIYRAEKLAIIDARTAKRLWIQFAKRGWRANEPGVVRADRATRFERMLEEAIATKQIKWSEVSAISGFSRNELNLRMQIAMGIIAEDSDSERSTKARDEEPPILRLRRE